MLSTEGVIISIEDVRELVARSQYSPSVGRYRVIVIEDADRMAERTSNVLLKALEEPPPAHGLDPVRAERGRPHPDDPLARAHRAAAGARHRRRRRADRRSATASTPSVAERAAREAQRHIGMAHRLATNAEARDAARRDARVGARHPLGRRTPSLAAATLLELAGDDAKAITAERDAEEREQALRSLGIEPGGTCRPRCAPSSRHLEDDQKRRATRSLRDGIDRILVDLLSLYRDVLLLQLGARRDELINLEHRRRSSTTAAARRPPAETLATIDAIATARKRIEGNVAPALALEACS